MRSSEMSARMECAARHASGASASQIARDMGRARSWVNKWLKRYAERVDDDGSWCEDKPRCGRPPRLTSALKKKVVNMTKGKLYRSVRAAVRRLVGKGVHVGRTTVHKALKEAGLTAYK